MKKAISIFAACLFALTSVKAQIAKGNLFIGTGLETTTYNFGTYTYNYSDADIKTQDQKNYTVSLSPQMGVFLTDHLIFGGNLDLAYNHDMNNISNTTDNLLTDNTTVNSTTVTVGPFIRYYFFDANPTTTLFYLQAEAGAGTGGGSTNASTLNTSGTNVISSGNTNGMFIFRAGGSLGLTHFIQKNIGLDVSVGYTYDDQSYTNTFNTQTTNSAGAVTNTSGSYKAKVPQNGLTLFAGFHFFIPTQK